AGQPMQVGIIHATFNGQIGVQFSDFSLTLSNAGPFSAAPSPATGLTLATNSGGLNISWTPGAGSSGSLVVVWKGTNVVKEMPVNGSTYTGNANYGFGSALPGAGYFVVYAGSGTSVAVGNLENDLTYNVAVYSY